MNKIVKSDLGIEEIKKVNMCRMELKVHYIKDLITEEGVMLIRGGKLMEGHNVQVSAKNRKIADTRIYC